MFITQQSKYYSTDSFVYCWKWKSVSVMMSHYKASLWETAANEYLFEPQSKGNVILLFVFILLTAERFSLTCLMPDVQMHLICIARVPCAFSVLTDVNTTLSFLRSHLQLMNWNSWCPLAAAAYITLTDGRMDEHADSLWSVSHAAPRWQDNVTGGAFMLQTHMPPPPPTPKGMSGYNLTASRGINQSQSIHYTDRVLKRRGEDREIKRGELQPLISSSVSLSLDLLPSSPNGVRYTSLFCSQRYFKM